MKLYVIPYSNTASFMIFYHERMVIYDYMRQGISTLTQKEQWTTPQHLITITEMAAEGFTIKQIAERIGVSRTTFYKWRQDEPLIEEALAKGIDHANKKIERSLFQRALGYDVEEIKYKWKYDANAHEYKWVEDSKVLKHIPGDTTCLLFWLRNKMPDEYRNNVQRELNGIQAHPSYRSWEKLNGVNWNEWEESLVAQRRELERVGLAKKKKK